MDINFNTSTIKPMFDWLYESKKGNKDENHLREILKMNDYKIEFERYGMEGLPVCNISFEESVDFFMNFEKKDFDNERLQYKKASFLNFYNNLEKYQDLIKMFSSIDDKDSKLIIDLLKNGLPDELINEVAQYNIILAISIGNSMGWPYENYIDFDIANLTLFKDKNTFLHVIAHEIHHSMFNYLLPDEMESEDYYLINFAFEGLAVHFNNNAYTKYKDKKYNYEMLGMSEEDWKLYENDFEYLFNKFKEDYILTKTLDFDGVKELLSNHYEKFEYIDKNNKLHKISQYPTYYLGCYFYGMIDNAFGKEVLFTTLKNPRELVNVYNQAVKELINDESILDILIIK